MKIVFVGIHNKPGFNPLDSKTKTGKIIDSSIALINYPVEKLNLFPVDYLPTEKTEINRMIIDFKKQVNVDNIYVLLGKKVQKYLDGISPNLIFINHPSWYIRNGIDNNFTDDFIKSLNEFYDPQGN